MSSTVYDSLLTGFARAAFDWEQDPFVVVLVDGGYAPDTAHETRADLGDHELGTMPGYDRGGKPLRGRSVDGVAPNGVRLSAGTVAWPAFTGRFRYVVICGDTGQRSNDRLVAVTDLGDQNLTSANVTVSYDQEGVCVFTPEVNGG